jgi:CRISPR/Cas system-associated endoribonuclease Cas2
MGGQALLTFLQGAVDIHKNISYSLNDEKKVAAIRNVVQKGRKKQVLSVQVTRCGTLQNSVFRGIIRDEKLLNGYTRI